MEDKDTPRRPAGITALVIAILFALYVWPGLWRYHYVSSGTALFRVDRLTGHVGMTGPYGDGEWLIVAK